jgi:hypothetical protein
MPGKIYRYLVDDHARLDRLLQRAAASPEVIEPSAYAEFRADLLKHIGMEEKILLPAAQRIRGGERLPIAASYGSTTALSLRYSCLPRHEVSLQLSAPFLPSIMLLRKTRGVFTRPVSS